MTESSTPTDVSEPTTWCVGVGNLYDGFQVVGPFTSRQASEWVEKTYIPVELSSIALELVPPDEFQPPPDIATGG